MKKPTGDKPSRPMTMKQFEGSKADKAVDKAALRKMNAKRKGK